jgi:hypothetical protein
LPDAQLSLRAKAVGVAQPLPNAQLTFLAAAVKVAQRLPMFKRTVWT